MVCFWLKPRQRKKHIGMLLWTESKRLKKQTENTLGAKQIGKIISST